MTLHTSADYLLGLTTNPRPLSGSAAMLSSEMELIELFYSLPNKKLERAIGILIEIKVG